MKYMKKLSSKLLLALGVMILSVIVWQVIVSKQVIGDMGKIKRASIDQLLKNKELKTYHAIPCASFSKIKLNGSSCVIIKGDEYGVYMSDYCKRYVEIATNGNELHINSLSGVIAYRKTPVFIFMPEDPQSVYYTNSDGDVTRALLRIVGFKGDNTLLSCEGGRVDIETDMLYVTVNQKDNTMYLTTFGSDTIAGDAGIQVKINAENSKLDLDHQALSHINADIQLRESAIRSLTFDSASKVGTLSLSGSLCKIDYYYYDKDRNRMYINYPGQCDSLIIRLTNNTEDVQQLFLSKDLSAGFEDIDCSDNIIVGRRE